MVHNDLFNCDENTLRAALMCLQNPVFRTEYERQESPFATVEGPAEQMKWPHWPPEHPPYVMQPPRFLCEFLAATEVGSGLEKGPTEYINPPDQDDSERAVL